MGRGTIARPWANDAVDNGGTASQATTVDATTTTASAVATIYGTDVLDNGRVLRNAGDLNGAIR